MDHSELLHAIERRLDEKIAGVKEDLTEIKEAIREHAKTSSTVKEDHLKLKSEVGLAKSLGIAIISLIVTAIGWLVSLWPLK